MSEFQLPVDTNDFSANRAIWMSQIAEPAYAAYYKSLIAHTPVKSVPINLNPFSVAPENIQGQYSPMAGIYTIAKAVTERLTDTELELEWERHPLSKHTEAIFHYTSVDDMASLKNGQAAAIRKHNQDSLQFAHAITMGLAHEAVVAATGEPNDLQTALKDTQAVLSNETFVSAVEQVSVTGFAVIKSGGAPAGGWDVGVNKFKNALGKAPQVPAIIMDTSAQQAAPVACMQFLLNPKIALALKDRLAKQNAAVAEGDVSGEVGGRIGERHFGRRGFSKGCPVAHNGTFTHMTRYLADTVAATIEALPAKSQ